MEKTRAAAFSISPSAQPQGAETVGKVMLTVQTLHPAGADETLH